MSSLSRLSVTRLPLTAAALAAFLSMTALTSASLAASDILAAQDALGVQQGIPRDTNNWAPRFGFAFDVFGS